MDIQKSKTYQKWKTAKSDVNTDWKTSGGLRVRIYHFFIFCLRWFLTLLITYSLTVTTVAYMIPFSVAYLSGSAKIAGSTDFISSLTMWLFPALAVTLILTALCIFLNYNVYRFFKKHLTYGPAKNLQPDAVPQPNAAEPKITNIKFMKPLSNRK